MSASKPWQAQHGLGGLLAIPSQAAVAGMQSPRQNWLTLFRILLKCSAQRARMSVFSVSKVDWSDHRTGVEPDACLWCEGRHEMFSCRGYQLLLVAPQLSSPISRSSSSAVSAGEAALPAGSSVSPCCWSCRQGDPCWPCADGR